jgi:hypothetical protein
MNIQTKGGTMKKILIIAVLVWIASCGGAWADLLSGGGGTSLPSTCSNGQTATYNTSTGKWDTCAAITDSTKLPLAGGTITGTLDITGTVTANALIIPMSGSDITLTATQCRGAIVVGSPAHNIFATECTGSGNSFSVIGDTANGPFSIVLPASPFPGTSATIIDGAGTFGTNNLTVSRNGQPINGVAADLILNVPNAHVKLVYYNATYGWRVLNMR